MNVIVATGSETSVRKDNVRYVMVYPLPEKPEFDFGINITMNGDKLLISGSNGREIVVAASTPGVFEILPRRSRP